MTNNAFSLLKALGFTVQGCGLISGVRTLELGETHQEGLKL